MSYSGFEGTIEGGRPAEIYHFNTGATSYFYTTADTDQVIAAQTYKAVAGLSRGSNADGPGKRDRDFNVILPTTDAVAQIFVGVMPGVRVRLTVSRFQRDDTPTPELVQIFDGFIQSASFLKQGKEAKLLARPELGSFDKQVPRRTYQSACNHVLFDPATCKVDDTNPLFRASALGVASLVGNVLTVTSGIAGLFPDGSMNGGYVEAIGASDFRTIRLQVGNVLTLMSPFSVTPSSVNAFVGCGHTLAICNSKFFNGINYGGTPFVPTKNPYQTGLL